VVSSIKLFVIDQLTDQNVDGTLMMFFILCNRTLQASLVMSYVKVTWFVSDERERAKGTMSLRRTGCCSIINTLVKIRTDQK